MFLRLLITLTVLTAIAASDQPSVNAGDRGPCSDDHVIVEGDISIPREEYLQRKSSWHLPRGKRAVTSLPERKWPNATIPFKISKYLNSNAWKVIHNAIDHWEEHTCIKFVPWTTEPDYVEFAHGKCGCCSEVGRQGKGRQQVSVQEYCTDFGVIVHEIGHVIGFWHEHSRPDRDEFVEIRDENIRDDRIDHFHKKSHLEINSFGQSYDYQSIMHYPRRSFSKNKEDTIKPLKRGVVIGQRNGLSQGDVIQARELYQCPKPGCGGNLTRRRGTIKSPYYPYNYPKDHDCVWIIRAPPGHRIVLRFLDFDVEYKERCSFDYVEVRFGANSSAPLNDIYCGAEKPEPVATCESSLWVKFHSDKTIVSKGFSATYAIEPLDPSGAVLWSGSGDDALSSGSGAWSLTTENGDILVQTRPDRPSSVTTTTTTAETEYYTTQTPCEQATENTSEECGGFLNATEGVIVVLPDAMENRVSMDCRWLIQGVERSRILAENIYLNMPKSEACEMNYLKIYEPMETEVFSNDTVLQMEYYRFHGKFCDSFPPSVVSSSNQLVLELHIGLPRTGFDFRNVLYVSYIIDLDECALNADECHHVCFNEVPGYACGCHSGYEIGDDGRSCRLKRVELAAECEGTLSSIRGMIALDKERPLEVVEHCTWVIQVPEGHKIMLYFTSLHLEDSEICDAYVEFMEGIHMESAGKFCGSVLPPMITLQTSVVRVHFHADHPNAVLRDQLQPSFVLSYTMYAAQQDRCFHNFKATPESRIFSSPNYPMNYDPDSMCMIRISAPRGYRVQLEFLELDIEETEYCAFDHVAVHDGRHRASVRIGQYCGTQVPKQPITSTGKSLLLLFVSDGNHSGRGFKARYRAVSTKSQIGNSNQHMEL